LIICPYITAEFNNINYLNYSSLILFDTAFYSVGALLWIMTMVHIFDNCEINVKYYVKSVLLTVIITLYSATSGLLLWALCLVPGLIFYVFEFVIKEDLSYLNGRRFRFFVINVLLSPLAKIFAVRLNFSNAGAFEANMNLVSLNDFFQNIFNVLGGWMDFFGVLPHSDSISAIGKYAPFYLCGFICFFAFFNIDYRLCCKICKRK